MGIMRHFTRSKRPESVMRTSFKGRPQISLPTQLISTSNMLAYTAPDVASLRPVDSSSASQHSAGDESLSINDPGLTDASSDTSASLPNSPVDRSRGYFVHEEHHTPSKLPRVAISTVDSTPTATPAFEFEDPFTVPPFTITPSNTPVPTLPTRAASHSKREHVRLAHCRSLRTSLRSSTNSATESLDPTLSAVAASPATVTAAADEPKHPFSQELEQLREAVEDFSGVDDFTGQPTADASSADEDAKVMQGLGLSKWTASQYVLDIEGLTEGPWFDTADFKPTWVC